MATTPTRPKIQRLPPLPPAETNYHRVRKRFQLVCFAIFVALPFLNLMRFDIPRESFYLAGVELRISEFAILFFAMMFAMFSIAAVALLYGRLYCGYACPQMIFSEWSTALEAWSKKWISRKFGGRRDALARAVFYAILGVLSIFLAFVFTSYFVEPLDLIRRLAHFDLQTAGGVTGAAVTLITFLDFTFVRQKFCTTVCPYGYLQGVIQDKQTLLVIYKDGTGDQKVCIECGKCVRVCEMGIDIRHSPYQIECVHCGECVDACEDVLRRIGRPGLIHYGWGEQTRLGSAEPWYKRWGFRDAKRIVVLFVLTFYLSGLAIALSMRRPVLVQVTPDRTYLYKTLADGRISNAIRIKAANRGSSTADLRIWTDQLPDAEFAVSHLSVDAGASIERTFDLIAPRWPGAKGVNHFKLFVQASSEKSPDVFELTFILPEKP
jgi:cytochrome c oxidase accessory protein FixG